MFAFLKKYVRIWLYSTYFDKEESVSMKRKGTLYTKLLVAYMFFAVIPLIAAATAISLMSIKSINKKTEALIAYKMDQTDKIIEEDINEIYALLYQIITNPKMTGYYEGINSSNLSLVTESQRDIRESFIDYCSTKDSIQSLTFIGAENEYYTYEKYNASRYDSVWDDINYRNEIKNEILEKDEKIFLPTMNVTPKLAGAKNIFFIGIPVYDYIAKDSRGVLLIGMDTSFFDGVKEVNGNEQGWNEIFQERVLVVDDDGNVVYDTIKENIGKKGKWDTIHEQLMADQKNYYINSREVTGSPWNFYSSIEKEPLLGEVYGMWKYTIIFSLLFSVGALCAIGFITAKYTKNLKIIAHGIRKFGEGEVGLQLELKLKDEFYEVIEQFNRMSTHIKDLIKRLGDEKKTTAEAIDKKRKAEIRALEAQINPHFIYNTLDTINWIAIENEQYEISELLSVLGSLMRYSTSNIDMVVLLQAEKEWLEKYMFLQRKRFGDSFDYQIDIESQAYDWPIYKMLMQPVVENSIIHGLQEKKTGGMIQIHIRVINQEVLKIVIDDNGTGIDKAVLERINSDVLEIRDDGKHHIGIRNIADRLNLYYSGGASLKFYNIDTGGTRVVIMIPYVKEVTHEDYSS